MFEGVTDADFISLTPVKSAKASAACRLRFIRLRSTEKLAVLLDAAVLDEIGGHHYDVQWAPAKRLLRIKASERGLFAPSKSPLGRTMMFRLPVPAGLVFSDHGSEPEFYVDAIGKAILIEVPRDFGIQLAGPILAKVTSRGEADPEAVVEAEALVVPRLLGSEKFTPSERRILGALLTRQQVTRTGLLMATADPAEPGDDDRDEKLIDVWFSKMRPRLAKLDITITNLGGGSFGLDQGSKRRLRALIDAGSAAA